MSAIILLWIMVLPLFTCPSVTAVINQGYRNCLLGTGLQSPLLLQDGLWCVQMQPETKSSWGLAMDLCNSRQGHLVNIYTSEEAKLFNSWIILGKSTAYDGYIGQKKVGLLNGNFTGYNIKWFTSRTDHIGIEQSHQYYKYSLWEEVPIMKNENRQFGCTFGKTVTQASYLGYGSFCPDGTTRKVFCQFISDQPPNGKFQAQRGQRCLAPVYKTAEQNHATLCGIECIRESWCMGYNAVQNTSGVSCQYIAVTRNDTENGVVQENGVSYYERVRG